MMRLVVRRGRERPRSSRATRSAARRARRRRASPGRTRRGSSLRRAGRGVRPQLAIAVVLQNQTRTGGTTAAPIARRSWRQSCRARRIPNRTRHPWRPRTHSPGRLRRAIPHRAQARRRRHGRRLARGGPELGRRVAIKMLHARYANDEQFVERFRREATHAAGLSHPNIVSIFDRGESTAPTSSSWSTSRAGRSRS